MCVLAQYFHQLAFCHINELNRLVVQWMENLQCHKPLAQHCLTLCGISMIIPSRTVACGQSILFKEHWIYFYFFYCKYRGRLHSFACDCRVTPIAAVLSTGNHMEVFFL